MTRLAAKSGFVLLLLALASCSEKPQAPPLSNEAVYQNEEIGLRFLTPEGWSVASRSDLPPGPLAKPATLVSFMQSKASPPAEFEVVAADLPADADPGEFAASYRGNWVAKSPGESMTINGAAATRYRMARTGGKDQLQREATAFRRGERVYFFFVTYSNRDPDRRDQARKSIESVTWTR